MRVVLYWCFCIECETFNIEVYHTSHVGRGIGLPDQLFGMLYDSDWEGHTVSWIPGDQVTHPIYDVSHLCDANVD